MIKHGHLRPISVKINRGLSHDSYEHSFVINFDHIGLFMAEPAYVLSHELPYVN